MAKSKLRTPQRKRSTTPINDLFLTPPRVVSAHEMSEDALKQTDLYKDFQKGGGSLLYGLNKERMPYLDVLQAKVGKNNPVTADHVNKAVLDRLFGLSGTPRKSTRADISEHYRKFYDVMADSSDPKVRLHRSDFPQNDKLGTNNKSERLIRRACKALMHRVKNGRIIHFCLDSINLFSAFNRTPETEGLYVSHTSAELRYIKKHWNRLKGHVKFYLKGKRVSTPGYIINETTDDGFQKREQLSGGSPKVTSRLTLLGVQSELQGSTRLWKPRRLFSVVKKRSSERSKQTKPRPKRPLQSEGGGNTPGAKRRKMTFSPIIVKNSISFTQPIKKGKQPNSRVIRTVKIIDTMVLDAPDSLSQSFGF